MDRRPRFTLGAGAAGRTSIVYFKGVMNGAPYFLQWTLPRWQGRRYRLKQPLVLAADSSSLYPREQPTASKFRIWVNLLVLARFGMTIALSRVEFFANLPC